MTGPGFGEQGDKFRRVVRTDKGPLYVERHEAPMLPPKPITPRWGHILAGLIYELVTFAILLLGLWSAWYGLDNDSTLSLALGIGWLLLWHSLPAYSLGRPRDGR